MKYSIIIPVYNGEKFLRECLDSVKGQTYKDFEVLMIDDGSKDASKSICDEFAEADKRFKAIHVENGGVSRARNIGIDASQGEYVCFVDCDDVLADDFLESGADMDFDVAFFGFTRVGKTALQKASDGLPVKLSRADVIAIQCKTIYDNGRKLAAINCSTVWAKMYKKDIIGDVRFPEGVRISEDKIFNCEVFSKVEKAFWNEKKAYYCRTHVESVMYSYADGYFAQGLHTFDLFREVIERIPDEVLRENCCRLFSERMVLILKIAIKLDWCHENNRKPYKVRKSEYEQARKNPMCAELLDECDVRALKKEDRFYFFLYTKGFKAINNCMKSKVCKATYYIMYRLKGKVRV